MKTFVLSICVLIVAVGYTQTCEVTVNGPSQVCPGMPVTITATGTITQPNQAFDFNNNSIPSGWTSSGGANYGVLCGNSLDNTPYFWASTAVGTPNITTATFDVCSGGTIEFEMKYAIQGGASPCEGPDEQDEGVSLQYSIDGGVTWIDIIYYSPWGFTLPSNPGGNSSISGTTIYTSWSEFVVPIPPGAQTTNTMFRWIQINSSGSCCDNWGLDNIFINAGPCLNASIGWDIYGANTPTGNSITVPIYNDTVIVAGVYDDNGVLMCYSPPFPVTVFDPYIDGGPDQSICQGQPVVLSGSNGTNFTWTNGVVDGVAFNPTTTQTYTVTGTDVNGCQATDQVVVTVNPLINYTLSYSQSDYCIDEVDPSPILSTVLAGTYTISPNTVSINATTGVVDLSTSTTTSSELYTVSFTPTNTCYQVATTQLTIHALPQVNAGNDVTICSGQATTLTASGAITYTWSNGASGTSIAVSPLSNATYTVTGTDTYGCQNTDQVLVTVNPLPNASITGTTSLCQFSTQPQVTFTGANGSEPYTFTYSVNNGAPQTISSVGGQAVVSVPTTTAGTFIYELISVQESSSNACLNQANGNAMITVWALPSVNAGVDHPVCDGFSTQLNGSGAVSYVWNNNVVNGVPFSPTTTQNYVVIGTDANGCSNSDTVQVTVIPIPVVQLSASITESCAPLVTTLTNLSTGNLSNCQWTVSNQSTYSGCGSVDVQVLEPGCHDVTLTVSTPEGCTNTQTFPQLLCVHPNPLAQFDLTPKELMTSNTFVNFFNQSVGAVSYHWNFGDGGTSSEINPTHVFPDTDPGDYIITLYASTIYGCMDSVSHGVRVLEDLIYYVPNTFTPDGDEFNNTFSPVLTAGFDQSSYRLEIFNRWGQLLFESNHYEQGWDGTYNNELQKEGVYIWKIYVKKKYNDEKVTLIGHVNLLK